MLTKKLSRRDLGFGATALALTACAKSGSTAEAAEMKQMTETSSNIDWTNLSEREWEERLTPMEFNVLRKEGTERPGSSPLNDEKRTGTYVCAGCELPLFTSEQKYESGTGWPSFTQPYKQNVVSYHKDSSFGMIRIEITCSVCDCHLGHVFPDGPKDESLRYCVNSISLKKRNN